MEIKLSEGSFFDHLTGNIRKWENIPIHFLLISILKQLAGNRNILV